MAITVLRGFDDVATDYVVVHTDGKGNTCIATPIVQVKPAMIVRDLRPDTSNRSQPARLAPVTHFASSRRQLRCFLVMAGQKIQFGILGSDGRCPLQRCPRSRRF